MLTPPPFSPLSKELEKIAKQSQSQPQSYEGAPAATIPEDSPWARSPFNPMPPAGNDPATTYGENSYGVSGGWDYNEGTASHQPGPGAVTPPSAPSEPGLPDDIRRTRERIAEIFGSDTPITLNQGIAGNPNAVLRPDYQGRITSFENEDAARDNIAGGRMQYEQESRAGQQRIIDQPNFGAAFDPRERGLVTPDREGMTMEAATRIAGGNRKKARSMIELEKEGYDPVTGQPAGQDSAANLQDMANLNRTVEQTETEQLQQEKLRQEINQTGATLGLTEAEKARDKKFGQELATWESGGAANSQANINSLNEVIKNLEEGHIKTRGLSDKIPFGNDWFRAIANPTGQDALDRVRGVVFQSLRETLGSQFTEKEGQRFVEASYNPRLSSDENEKRLKDYVKRLESSARARNSQIQYLKQNRTLQGYSGEDPEQVMLGMLDNDVNSPISGDVDIPGDIDSIVNKY